MRAGPWLISSSPSGNNVKHVILHGKGRRSRESAGLEPLVAAIRQEKIVVTLAKSMRSRMADPEGAALGAIDGIAAASLFKFLYDLRVGTTVAKRATAASLHRLYRVH